MHTYQESDVFHHKAQRTQRKPAPREKAIYYKSDVFFTAEYAEDAEERRLNSGLRPVTINAMVFTTGYTGLHGGNP